MKSLTNDTSRGLSRTCKGLVDLAKHLISKKVVVVCHVGVSTSVPLENQFGRLRQGCGGTYFITVLQILEKVERQNFC